MGGSFPGRSSKTNLIALIILAYFIFTPTHAISRDLYSGSFEGSDRPAVQYNPDGEFIPGNHTLNGDSVHVSWTRYFDEEFYFPDDEVTAMCSGENGSVYVTGFNTWNGYSTVKLDSSGNLVWTAVYTPQNAPDKPIDIIIDESSNVYVAGQNGGDFVLLKYNTNGELLWESSYDGGYGIDYPTACVLDDDGGIIVTGGSEGPTGGDYYWHDIATVKFNQNGEIIWEARYDGPAGSSDFPEDIGTDSWGNIYVTGKSRNKNSRDQLITIKYSSQGSEKWVDLYSGTDEFPRDRGMAITVDTVGNVYVVGTSHGTGNYDDFVTLQYDENGSIQWVSRFEGASGFSFPRGIELDMNGNIIVGGTFNYVDSFHDIIIIKYQTDGSELWHASYDVGFNGNEFASDISVDTQGSIYVTGYTAFGNTPRDILTVKYSSDGILMWDFIYDGPANGLDEGVAIDLDQNGHASVAGTVVGTGTGSDYAVLRFDPSGTLEWTRLYNDPDGKPVNQAQDMIVSQSGDVYVSGHVRRNGTSSAHNDIALVKYTTTGELEWYSCWDDGHGKNNAPHDIDFGPNGDILICGETEYPGWYEDFLTLKYDQDGSLLWTERFGDTTFTEIATSLDIDANGNIIVTGRKSAYSYDPAYLTVSYDSQGNIRWFDEWDSGGESCGEPLKIIADSEGNSYICGKVEYDYAIFKYTSQGDLDWIKRHDGFAHWYDYPEDMILDTNGNIYVTGTSRTSGNRYVCMTVSYSPGGGLRWESIFEGNDASGGKGYTLAIDETGSIYVIGTCEDANGLSDMVTVKYDQDGNEIWTAVFHGPAGFEVLPEFVVIDPLGGICVTGFLYENGWNRDFITVKYDEYGTERWAASFDGLWDYDDHPAGMGVDSDGNMYVAGTTSPPPPDYRYVFSTIKYEQLLVSGDPRPSQVPISMEITGIYPNPMGQIGSIEYTVPRSMPLAFQLYDISGRNVKSWSWDTHRAGYHSITWDLRDTKGIPVPNGTYFLRIAGEGAHGNRPVIVLR